MKEHTERAIDGRPLNLLSVGCSGESGTRILKASNSLGNGMAEIVAFADICSFEEVIQRPGWEGLRPEHYFQIGPSGEIPIREELQQLIDAMVLCTLPATPARLPYLVQAVDSQWAVLEEKPMATSLPEAVTQALVIKKAQAKGGSPKWMLVAHYHYNPLNIHLMELVRRSELENLGKIRMIYGCLLEADDPSDPRPRHRWLFTPASGGGVANDTLGHMLVVPLGLGAEVTVVEAQWDSCLDSPEFWIGTQLRKPELFARALLSLQGALFTPDASAIVECGKKIPLPHARKQCWIEFERGAAFLDYTRGILRIGQHQGRSLVYVDRTDPYVNVLKAFRDLVLADKPPQTDLEFGLTLMEITDQFYQSCRQCDYYRSSVQTAVRA